MNNRFAKLSAEPRPVLASDRLVEAVIKTTRVLRRERQDFMRDRLGHNEAQGHAPRQGRITYMAHAKGYVMARRPGCIPFVIPEKLWLSFPYYWDEPDNKRLLP